MIIVYGILDNNNTHIDVAKTLHGAKCYATWHDFDKVTQRIGYNAHVIAEKLNGKWVERPNY